MKPRTIFAAFFSIFYLLLVSGVFFSVHFCHGKPVSIDISMIPVEEGCGEMPCVKNCCDNESVFLKVTEAHKGQQDQILVSSPLPVKTQAAFSDLLLQDLKESISFYSFSGPPPAKASEKIILLGLRQLYH